MWHFNVFKHTLFDSSSVQQVVKRMAQLKVAPLQSAHPNIQADSCSRRGHSALLLAWEGVRA